MITRLTRKTNNEWNWDSQEGPPKAGIVCFACGMVVDIAYGVSCFGGYFCTNCFKGDKTTALKAWVGRSKLKEV